MAKHALDKCEMPGCGTSGRDLTFVSYAVNPKTQKKGMLLCNKHEQAEVRNQRNG